jgi:flagellar basal-body rod protein FlgF
MPPQRLWTVRYAGMCLADGLVANEYPDREESSVLKGLRAAETAMNIQLTKTNVLANNLANVDTAGFKQVLTQVTEMTDGDPGRPGGAPAQQGLIDQILDLRAPIDMTQGQLRETGRTFDVALKGDGLIKVTKDGREHFTRNGAFSLDGERKLSTPDGAAVQGAGGPITIPDGEVVIRGDGMILVDGAELDRLSIVGFEDSGRLRHVGGSLFSAPDDMPAKALAADEVSVAQGMLERSNANPIDTMIGMIAAQRAFEMEAKVLQASDRTLDKAINELSRKA